MIAAPQLTSASEVPVYFDAAGDTLFGILTLAEAETDLGAVVLSGGGATAPATNRNRLSVHLCRALAARGLHALRFDYHGIAESGGVLAGAPKVYEPFVDDLDGAVRCMAEQGVRRLVLIGACFGARTALSHAPALGGVETLILVSPPLRDLDLEEEAGVRLAMSLGLGETLRRVLRLRTLAGLLDPMRRNAYRQFAKARIGRLGRRLAVAFGSRSPADDWVSGDFLTRLQQLARRRVPVLFVYGTEDHHYRDFAAAREGRLGRILDRAPLTEVVMIEGEIHGLSRIDFQRRVADVVFDWMDRYRVLGQVAS